MLDPHRLRVFRAVVASGSVTQAAANLFLTPSSVSQHVAALQRETGLRLIERDGRGIKPTAAGRRLAAEAGAVLQRLGALDALVGDLREHRLGSLSVAYFASAGAAWIPPVVATLIREFPELSVDLQLIELASEHESAPDVEIFVQGAASSPPPGYDVTPLLEEPYVVVLPQQHRLAGKPAIPLGDLTQERWVDNDPTRGPCRQALLDACAAAGFSPSFQVETHDYTTAIALVAVGVGVTVMPRLGTHTHLPPGLTAVPIVDPVPIRRIAVRVRSSLHDHPATRRLLQLLRDQIAAQNAR